MKLKIKIDFTYVKLFIVCILCVVTFVSLGVAALINSFLLGNLITVTIMVTIVLALLIFIGYVIYSSGIFHDIKDTCPIKILKD